MMLSLEEQLYNSHHALSDLETAACFLSLGAKSCGNLSVDTDHGNSVERIAMLKFDWRLKRCNNQLTHKFDTGVLSNRYGNCVLGVLDNLHNRQPKGGLYHCAQEMG